MIIKNFIIKNRLSFALLYLVTNVIVVYVFLAPFMISYKSDIVCYGGFVLLLFNTGHLFRFLYRQFIFYKHKFKQ